MDDITKDLQDCQDIVTDIDEGVTKLKATNAELLEALHAFLNHVPELWGDEVRDGYIRLNVAGDTIDQIEAAVAKGE